MTRETNLAQVAAYVAELAPAVGGCKKAVNETALRHHFKHSEITEMVSEVKQMFCLNNGLRLGLVNKGGPENASAWIDIPTNMPMFGTVDFAKTKLTLYVRKTFVAKASFYSLCCAISHELSHVVIESLRHRLKRRSAPLTCLP